MIDVKKKRKIDVKMDGWMVICLYRLKLLPHLLPFAPLQTPDSICTLSEENNPGKKKISFAAKLL